MAPDRKDLLASVPGFRTLVGGEAHSGWLPEHAATPQEEPLDVLLELWAVRTNDGVSLQWTISAPSGQSIPFAASGDYWCQNLDSAIEQAQYTWGVPPSEWALEQ